MNAIETREAPSPQHDHQHTHDTAEYRPRDSQLAKSHSPLNFSPNPDDQPQHHGHQRLSELAASPAVAATVRLLHYFGTMLLRADHSPCSEIARKRRVVNLW